MLRLPRDLDPPAPGFLAELADPAPGRDGPFGSGATAPCARLYTLDENNKIKTEQVIFYVAQG